MISRRARLVTMNETWLYHYDLETKQRSMEWRHSGSPRPKKFRVQKFTGNVRLDFLGSRRHPPHWLSYKGPNYQRGVLPIFAGVTEGHFWGKTPREGQQGGLVLARQCPGSPGNCNPEETGLPGLPLSLSLTLFFGSGSVGLRPVVPWTEEKKWNFAIFLPTRRSLLPRRPGWTDKLLNFFLSDLQKLEQRAKKCIELRGEYVE